MTIKFEKSPGAAYEVAVGITAQEASDAGLAVVEQSFATNPPTPIYGRYIDAPKGHPLGVTIDTPGDTKVIGAGGVAVAAASGGGDKGSLLNINDPVVHGGTGEVSVHADNAAPLADDDAEQARLLREGAHNPTKPNTDKKNAK